MNDEACNSVVLAGASGDLGFRIARALVARGAEVRALVRATTADAACQRLKGIGITPLVVDIGDPDALQRVMQGAVSVVSALNGLRTTMIDDQTRLLDAAVTAGVARFIPSDFSLDYTRTRPGDNRNMDLRREFMTILDQRPIQVTSILNGAFAEVLIDDMPMIVRKPLLVLAWGGRHQPFDFTTKDDVARFTAAAALDQHAPRWLRIVGDVITPFELAGTLGEVCGHQCRMIPIGGERLLTVMIQVAKRLAPGQGEVFPAWQGMQYLRDMASGRGRLMSLDNERYAVAPWMTVRDLLNQTAMA